MSNWYSFHHLNTIRPKKDRPFDVISSVLMIIIGIGIMLLVLKVRGIHPLRKTHSIPELSQPVFFHPAVAYWEQEIIAWGDQFDLDPLLIATVMQIESCGNPVAVSLADAQGLFQVMPYHFRPGEPMLDPHTNALRGLDYLKQALILAHGDVHLALAGYNGGHRQISRRSDLWPDETKRYVYWGWGIYQDALKGDPHGETLSAWLNAGGWSLCQRAQAQLGLP